MALNLIKTLQTRGGLRAAIGLSLVFGHFMSMALCIALSARYLEFTDAFDLIAIQAPLFSMFSLAVVRHTVKHQSAPKDRRRVNGMFATISIFITVFFLMTVFLIIAAYPLKWVTSIEHVKKGVGICEALIATYLGLIIESLFPASNE